MGLEVMMTFSNGAEEFVNVVSWKKANIKWMEETFGKENIIAITYHGDESTPHLHGIVIPMVDNKLNGTYYVGNKQKLRNLQDSYAKAMAPLGMERGLQKSLAKHTDIKKFYAVLNREVAKELPEIIPGETIENYRDRANNEYIAANLNHLNEKLVIERKVTEAKTILRNEAIKLKDIINNLSKKLRKYETLDQEFGGFERVREYATNHKMLQDGLKNYVKEKPEEHTRISMFNDFLNFIMQWQRKKEKKRTDVNKENEFERKRF